MADQYSNEGGSTGSTSGNSSSSMVELKIKTLDSQIYSFCVDRNMPVVAFKEKIANEIGLPVGQQRLIFRGRVLKDEHPLSEYQVDDGHTLHLVARQPAESQSSSDRSSADATGNIGSDAVTGAPRNRVGQISHSVVLGTFNVGDQGEGTVPDIGQVIGAVLNSFGISGQNALNGIGGIQSAAMPRVPGQFPSANETSGANVDGRSQTNNQTSGQTFPSQPFQAPPNATQIPLPGALPFPSINSPLPDSLSTLSEFMSRVEQVLVQGYQLPNASPGSLGNLDSSGVELPSNERGLRTPGALSIVLRNAEHLLSHNAVAALSHIAGRLEQDGSSSDPNIRGQIQTEAMQVGLGMHYLGSLFLELGRTIWTLRMGQSPTESAVNSGPAVFISSSGPNPIMVQPFPSQAIGGSVPPSASMASGPLGIGGASRNINIHIHAGTASLAPVVSALSSRANNGEGTQAERNNGASSGGSGTMRVVPVGSVVSAAVPALSAGVAVPNSALVQLGRNMPVPQLQADPQSIPSMIAEINAHLVREATTTRQGENQAISDNQQSNSTSVSRAGGLTVSLPGNTPGIDSLENQDEHGQVSIKNKEAVLDTQYKSSSLVQHSTGETSVEPDLTSVNASSSGERYNNTDVPKTGPLGLGVGGLERKKRMKQPKSEVQSTASEVASTPHGQSNSTGIGQHILQSLASRSSAANMGVVDEPRSVPNSTLGGRRTENTPMREQGSNGQFDAASAMSQVLGSPAMSGLLGGISNQTGLDSSNVLGNMLQRLVQNPQIMNTVSEIAQQVDSQDIGNLFSGGGSGQPGIGGIDLSTMFRQMMPVVSQVLSSTSTGPQTSTVGPNSLLQDNDTRAVSVEDFNGQDVQRDLEEVACRMEQCDTPGDIFRAVAEHAAFLGGSGSGRPDVAEELAGDDNLVSEYMEMLRRDLQHRLHDNSGQDRL